MSSSLGGLTDLIQGLVNFNKQFPEINRSAIAKIARRAVELAKENIDKGGDPTQPWSFYTPEITKKLSKGKRESNEVLNENGKLRKSIRVTVNTVAFGKIYVEIGSNLIYAAILEYGGNPGGAVGDGGSIGFIPPRPYLRPAINQAIYEAADWIEADLARAYDLSIQGKSWKGIF